MSKTLAYRFQATPSFVSVLHCLVLLFCTLSFSSFAQVQTSSPPQNEIKGTLAIIGGALRSDNAAVWQRIVADAGGKGAKIAIIPAASANPDRTANSLIATFKQFGADAYLVPLSIKYLDANGQANFPHVNRDPHWLEKIRQSNAVYFSGGDQARITKVLFNEDGSNTPLLDAIWDLYRGGGLIAGSSAGAAIMSDPMFFNAKTVLSTLQNGVRQGHELTRGLGFIGAGIFVDQHLIIRGRFARMLPVMQSQQIPLGLGVDENTAMFISQQRTLEVVGYKGVIVLDLSQHESNRKLPYFNLQNVRISYLSHGDKLDLHSKIITPSADKERLKVAQSEEADQQPRMYSDILANTAVVELMSNLIESPAKAIKGLAFDARPDGSSLGFELTFQKTPESVGYYGNPTGMDSFMISGLRLDLQPIRIKKPLYQVIK